MAQDWPEFRGPNRSGISVAKGLPSRFDAQTNIAWSVEVPTGRSSPIISGKRLFLTAADAKNLMVVGFDSRSGKVLWRHSKARTRVNEIDGKRNDPASPTPATDGQAVYAFFQYFGLVAVSVQGKLMWELPLGPFLNNYGLASSPVLHGETIFFQCDQVRGSYVIAVNKRTGLVRWRVNRPNTIEGWSTPLILPDAGELVVLSSNGLEALDVETGKTKGFVPAAQGLMIPVPITDGKRLIATFRGSDQPLFPTWEETLRALDSDGDGRLVVEELSKRYDAGSFGIADPDRDGHITGPEWNIFRNRGAGEFGITSLRLEDKSVAWRYKRGLPYVPSPILYQGIIYSVRGGGIVAALNADTGEVRKEGRLPEAADGYFASPIAADGKIYLASAEGKVSVLKADADWEVLAVNDIGDGITASPAIADGSVFIRTRSRLYCFRQR
ncbi:MAG: PQQ-binding-like beta-propeller repeat protein [Bryobacteraceae bacterium]